MSLFITLEGPSGCGKSTIIKELTKTLCEFSFVNEVKMFRDPGGDPVSEALRVIGKNPPGPISTMASLFVFVAARIQTQKMSIEKFLAEHPNNIAICDRWSDSTRVYQRFAQNIPLDTIEKVLTVSNASEPDMTFVLQLSVEDLITRRNSRVDEEADMFEVDSFTEDEVHAYDHLVKDMTAHQQAGFVTYNKEPEDRVKYIPNSGTVNEALAYIKHHLSTLFFNREEEFHE